MSHRSQRFAELLSSAIRAIHARENKLISAIQDELGFALGKKGGASLERWRRGYLPAKLSDIEQLTRELVSRGGFESPDQVRQFLVSAEHPSPDSILDKLAGKFASPPPAAASGRVAETESNPFIVGPPVRRPGQFFGRVEAVDRLFSLFRPGVLQNGAIIGAKRSGKTSLLHYLSQITTAPVHQLRPGQKQDWLGRPERVRWVFVDFQDPRMGSRKRLLTHILQGLKLPVPAEPTLFRFLDSVGDHLQTPAIILMDEMGAGLEAPELDRRFWNSLRSLSTNLTQGTLAFVLAAHESPAQLAYDEGKTSPFFNIFGHTIRLGPFTRAEAFDLLDMPAEPFSEADRAWMVRHSRRWPCALQAMGYVRYEARRRGAGEAAWQTEALAAIQPFEHLWTA